MAVPNKGLLELVYRNIEVDLIEAEVKALKEGLISKEVFDNRMLLKSKVPIAERYTTLLRHVHETLQERLNILDAQATATQAVAEGLIEKNILVNIASLDKKIPASLKARYLLLFLHPALQRKLEWFMSHIMTIQFMFTKYEDVWFKLSKYTKTELISKTILTPLFPKLKDEEKNQQHDVIELLQKERDRLNHYIKSYGKVTLSRASSSQSGAITTLGPQHLSKLSELFVNYSYNWKNIGVALNFQPQDLETIEATPLLIPGAPKSYLVRLLQDWLQMTLRHTLPPTVENLKKALNSQTVGLGALVGELQAIGSNNTHSYLHEYNQPYSSITVSFDTSEPSVYPKHNEVYIGEGESTILEIQVTTAEEAPVYKWLLRGEVCGSDPILYLPNADIIWDGNCISCEVKALSSIVTVSITMHVSCPLDEFIPSLSSMYLRKPEVPEDTWPPTGSTKYINLAIIKQQKVNYGSEYVRCTIRGGIDDIIQHKETIDYKRMYDSLKSESQVMFIEGRPGSGKTTFVHKITHDWASNSSGGIRILLLVSLRVLNALPNPNLSDTIGLFRDLKVIPELIEKRDGKGVCFIFDGLDEFSPSDGKDSIVYKIINKSYLHQSTVVVASRPAALAKLRNKADKIIEVIGFLGNQIQEYFDHYPFSDATKPVKLKAYLSLHPNILHMCYLPIHATMVAFLFEITGQVPKTETKMYALFTHFTLMRSISKSKEIESNARDNVMEYLNEVEGHYFKQICHLALNKTLSNKQVLQQKEINSFFQATKKGDISLGLICIDRTVDLYSFKDVYTFLHLSFQEYLAAYHISTLSDEEQMKLIEEHGHKNHMLEVWKFFCGLVDVKPFDNKFKTLLHKTQGNTLYHFQCAYESQQKIVCAQLLKSEHYDVRLANKFLSTPDFTAIGYVTNKTILPMKLSLANCDVDTVAIDALLSEMEDTSKQSLESLHIEMEVVNPELVSKVLANFQSLKSLSVVKQTQDVTSQQLLKSKPALTECEEFPVLKKIQTLTLNGFQSQEFQMMISALRQCDNLTKLNIADNSIGKLGAKYLSESLPHCRSLQKINISQNGIPSDGVIDILRSMKRLKIRHIKADEITNQGGHDILSNELLLKSLKPFTNLQGLDIVLYSKHADLFVQVSKGWKGLKELRVVAYHQHILSIPMAVSKVLKLYFHGIEVLVIKNITCDLEVANKMSQGLQQCPNLKVLELSCSVFTQEHLKLLLSVNFSRLEELYLNNSQICDNKITILSSHLQRFPYLQVLSLSNNSFTRYGGEALAIKLHHCTKLVKLDLQDNWIDSGAAHAIAAGLQSCSDFQLLCLSRQNCEYFANTFEQEVKEDRKQRFGCDAIEFV